MNILTGIAAPFGTAHELLDLHKPLQQSRGGKGAQVRSAAPGTSQYRGVVIFGIPGAKLLIKAQLLSVGLSSRSAENP
jgi:hypothetical protein